MDALNSPFVQGLGFGLAVGLIAAVWLWIAGWQQRRNLRKEGVARLQAVEADVEKLRQHLHTQMQITAKGTEEQQKQLADLRQQNENLRVMVQGLQQKPERSQQRALEVWQRALDRMSGRAPGFPAAWQQAVAEAETEMAEAESGLTKFVRKFLGTGKSPALPGAATTEMPSRQETTEA